MFNRLTRNTQKEQPDIWRKAQFAFALCLSCRQLLEISNKSWTSKVYCLFFHLILTCYSSSWKYRPINKVFFISEVRGAVSGLFSSLTVTALQGFKGHETHLQQDNLRVIIQSFSTGHSWDGIILLRATVIGHKLLQSNLYNCLHLLQQLLKCGEMCVPPPLQLPVTNNTLLCVVSLRRLCLCRNIITAAFCVYCPFLSIAQS